MGGRGDGTCRVREQGDTSGYRGEETCRALDMAGDTTGCTPDGERDATRARPGTQRCDVPKGAHLGQRERRA